MIGPVLAATPTAPTPPVTLARDAAGSGSTGLSFASILSEATSSVADANRLGGELATGRLVDIHDYTIAAAKAQTSMQIVTSIRNQAISAFQEIMRMQL